MEQKHYTYYNNGKVKSEQWFNENKKLHREYGPAVIDYEEDGQMYREMWYINGQQHREDGPALIVYDKKGDVEREIWRINGLKHREDGPALIKYEYGQITEEEWFFNDRKHREDGPSIINYARYPIPLIEEWYTHGEPRCDYGLPSIIYYEEGKKNRECWSWNGHWNNHNYFGPDIIDYNIIGKIQYIAYHNNILNEIMIKLFGKHPATLTKEEHVLVKLSLPPEYFQNNY